MPADGKNASVERKEEGAGEVMSSTPGSDLKAPGTKIHLIPQPSSDPRDPLNWPFSRKCIVAFAVYLAVFAGHAGPFNGQAQLTQQAAVYHKEQVEITYFVSRPGDLALEIQLFGFGPLAALVAIDAARSAPMCSVRSGTDVVLRTTELGLIRRSLDELLVLVPVCARLWFSLFLFFLFPRLPFLPSTPSKILANHGDACFGFQYPDYPKSLGDRL
jgi:hypothetical protein